MKAILVIDVPLEDSIDFAHLDIRANVKVDAYDDLRFTFKPIEFKHIKVEAMPKKKEPIPITTHHRENAELEIANQHKGWNDCIDEILGEEK